MRHHTANLLQADVELNRPLSVREQLSPLHLAPTPEKGMNVWDRVPVLNQKIDIDQVEIVNRFTSN